MITRYANPHKFQRLSQKILPWFFAGMGMFLISGYLTVFLYVPVDEVQGDIFKILYLHVPMAWFSVAFYGGIAFCSLFYLIWKHLLAFYMARALAQVGLVFTLVCLITGSLWGKPMWGTYWVWDARLTSVAILGFLYGGYLILSSSFLDSERAALSASVLGVLGAVNLPLIKGSVSWWNTLHQGPTILKLSAPSMPLEMLIPLIICSLGWLCYGISMVLILMNSRIRKTAAKNRE